LQGKFKTDQVTRDVVALAEPVECLASARSGSAELKYLEKRLVGFP